MYNNGMFNRNLREYIKQLALERLEGSKDFVKVYGRGFVERKFEENVEGVFSNDEASEDAGYYNLEYKEITICASGENGRLLTPEEVEQDEYIKATCVHETIHAILRRIVESKAKINGKTVIIKNILTGTLGVRRNKREIGRGLNEGLTEWICKKAGLKAESYKNLVRIVELLEIAIGTSRVMRLGKGKVARNLGMSKEESDFFLELLDQEYILEKNQDFYERAQQILTENDNLKEVEGVKRDIKIKRFLQSQEYERAILERGEDKSTEILLSHIQKQLGEVTFARGLNLILIDSAIFNKYFTKEFEKIQEKQEMTYEQLQKFSRISELMKDYTEREAGQGYYSIKFKKEFAQMRGSYLAEFEVVPDKKAKGAQQIALRNPIDKIRSYLFKGKQETPKEMTGKKEKQIRFRERIIKIANYEVEPLIGGKMRKETDSIKRPEDIDKTR